MLWRSAAVRRRARPRDYRVREQAEIDFQLFGLTVKNFPGYVSLEAKVSAASFLFAVFLAMAVAWLDGWLRSVLSVKYPWPESGLSTIGQQWLRDLAVIIVLLVIGLVTSFFINVNHFSLHAVYRNRLVRAFLGSARARGYPTGTADAFTGFDAADNLPMAKLPKEKPLHLINLTLNIRGIKNLAWQELKAEGFSMTPRAVGNPNVGYRPTASYANPEEGITIGTAMAISGAAENRNMGTPFAADRPSAEAVQHSSRLVAW